MTKKIIIASTIVLLTVLVLWSKARTPNINFLYQFYFIKYDHTEKYATKLAANDSALLVLNYDVGHQSFYSSTSVLELINHESNLIKRIETTSADANFQEAVRKFDMKPISINSIWKRRKAFILHNGWKYTLSFHSAGVYLHIKKGSEHIKKRIHEIAPNGFICLKNIHGDQQPELLILIQDPNFWDSQSYICKVYQSLN